MEIERKFKIKNMPDRLSEYRFHKIEQAYLNTDPVIRVRRQDQDYYLTYKKKGFLAREEYNLPLDQISYRHLLQKADGNIISKTRYLIPMKEYDAASDLTIELDMFDAPFAPLAIAEVEFETEEQAAAFQGPEWFGEEVTYDESYHNSTLSKRPVSPQTP